LKFKMVPESLYMTVSIIDRYLELKQVRRSRLQLVGVAALLVSTQLSYPHEHLILDIYIHVCVFLPRSTLITFITLISSMHNIP
jgi:hypothetical protein